jgi:XisH protein
VDAIGVDAWAALLLVWKEDNGLPGYHLREKYSTDVLGAERLVAAERNHEKIAVGIKSFHGASDVRDLEMALGQYVFYRSLLARFEPGRKLFLAVPYSIFVSTLDEPIARPVLADLAVACLAFDPHQEVIVT